MHRTTEIWTHRLTRDALTLFGFRTIESNFIFLSLNTKSSTKLLVSLVDMFSRIRFTSRVVSEEEFVIMSFDALSLDVRAFENYEPHDDVCPGRPTSSTLLRCETSSSLVTLRNAVSQRVMSARLSAHT